MLQSSRMSSTVWRNICGSCDSGSSSMASKSASIGCWYWPITARQTAPCGPWHPYFKPQAPESSGTFELKTASEFYLPQCIRIGIEACLVVGTKSSMSTGLVSSLSSQQPSLIVGRPQHEDCPACGGESSASWLSKSLAISLDKSRYRLCSLR